MTEEQKKDIEKFAGKVVEALLFTESRRATKYVSDKFVITATRRVFKGKIDKRDKSIDVVMKIGKPNFAEREFIKKLKLVKEPFPVKKIVLNFFKK